MDKFSTGFKPDTLVYNIRLHKFGTVIKPFCGLLEMEICVFSDFNPQIWMIGNCIAVEPNTPEKQLEIKLRYG